MERAIKLLVLAWTAVALAAEVWLLRGGGAWPSLGLLAPAGVAATAALMVFDRRAVAMVLAFETAVSRMVQPRDFGVPDDRDLGMLVKWSFVDAPPAR